MLIYVLIFLGELHQFEHIKDIIFSAGYKVTQNIVRMRYRDTYHDEDFVIAKTEKYYGYPEIVKTIENRMRRLLKLAGLNSDLTPHSLRHTHTSLLAEFGAIGVFAASGSMIEVFYNIKDIKIDKVSKMPEQKPFMYNGTTYVPLRYISENLGEQVKWDNKTQTIHIGEIEEDTVVYPKNGIEPMNEQIGHRYNNLTYGYKSSRMRSDNIGNSYESYIILEVSDWAYGEDTYTYVEFPLNGNYKSFKADLAIPDEYKSSKANMTLVVNNDGEEVYRKNFVAGDMPDKLNVDVSGVAKIQIKLTTDSNGDGAVGLFNAYFTK